MKRDWTTKSTLDSNVYIYIYIYICTLFQSCAAYRVTATIPLNGAVIKRKLIQISALESVYSPSAVYL